MPEESAKCKQQKRTTDREVSTAVCINQSSDHSVFQVLTEAITTVKK